MLHDLAIYEVLGLSLLKLHVIIPHIRLVFVSCIVLLPHHRLQIQSGLSSRVCTSEMPLDKSGKLMQGNADSKAQGTNFISTKNASLLKLLRLCQVEVLSAVHVQCNIGTRKT